MQHWDGLSPALFQYLIHEAADVRVESGVVYHQLLQNRHVSHKTLCHNLSNLCRYPESPNKTLEPLDRCKTPHGMLDNEPSIYAMRVREKLLILRKLCTIVTLSCGPINYAACVLTVTGLPLDTAGRSLF